MHNHVNPSNTTMRAPTLWTSQACEDVVLQEITEYFLILKRKASAEEIFIQSFQSIRIGQTAGIREHESLQASSNIEQGFPSCKEESKKGFLYCSEIFGSKEKQIKV